MGKRRVFIAYVGGTIGMQKTGRGYAPAPGFLAEQLAEAPQMRAEELPSFVLREYDPLLDSSNMRPSDWLAIARDIEQHSQDFDAVLVIHGTDTMAYTASSLSFCAREPEQAGAHHGFADAALPPAQRRLGRTC
ncbi:MAG: asparaginase domain-containing protein [Planctomycetota bacterium]